MQKKIFQADFLLSPDSEFWHLYILLHKEKGFFFECVAHSLEEQPNHRGYYRYEHAYFTLDGDIIDFNMKMHASLIAYCQRTLATYKDKFRKEINMATKSAFEQKVQTVTNELGDLLKKKDHSQAWTKAGELNSLLKKEEAQNLKPEFTEQVQYELKGYYYINSELEKLNKRLFAKGNKLIELSNI